MSNNLASVLQFLKEAYSTINILRSMLSVTLKQMDGKGVGGHPLVIRLMKGIFLNKPFKPGYVSTWSIDAMLSFVSDLGVDENLPLMCLSKKLVFLLFITT